MQKLLFKWHQRFLSVNTHVYTFALILIPAGLLFSRALLSIGFILFIINWLIEGEYNEKWKRIKKSIPEILISSILIIHLIGLIHTENLDYGFKDLKIKLPLLLPIFYFSTKQSYKILNIGTLLLVFAISTLTATLAGFINFQFLLKNQTVDDLKNISLMGQNIMLSWFVNFSIIVFFYHLQKNWKTLKNWLKVLLLLAISWCIIFLYLLNSLTGYVIFIALFFYSLYYIINQTKNRILILSSIALLLISGILSAVYINKQINNFFKTEYIDYSRLEEKTINGNDYFHNIESKRTENGHYIDVYISEKELEKEWNKLSQLNYRGKDNKGQLLSETLIRYLSSKGLRKDSTDVSKLEKNEISYIEDGCANYMYTKKYRLDSRIYSILWQIRTYRHTGNATAQSISQRVEFLKSAIYIIKHHFWLGVGSGDVMDTFNKTLEKLSPSMEAKYRNRVHNQYIVEFVALGFTGFVIFIFLIFYPVICFRIWKNFLFSAFYLIVLISFLTDNPLETQLGVSFFSYFYCILLDQSTLDK
jgi:hypothetical protein